MPGLDGLTLARAIQADPLIARTPLLLLTSVGEHGYGNVFGAVLTKPARQSQLLRTIASVLGVPAAAAPAVGQVTVSDAEPSHLSGPLVLVAAVGTMSCAAVLMDIQVPELDGFDATAEIRQHESGSRRHIPIFAMTANTLKGDQGRCLAAGMDDYLSKPVRLQELDIVIRRWVTLVDGIPEAA